ncbi:MAG: antifreeze protein [Pseudomonadota bacterium]
MHVLPIAYWALSVRTAQMLAEAQTVVAFRVMGMAGGWPVSPSENARMVLEKGPAFIQAYGDAATAAMKGKRLDEIAEAALKPIGRRTRSNAKRLSRQRRR